MPPPPLAGSPKAQVPNGVLDSSIRRSAARLVRARPSLSLLAGEGEQPICFQDLADGPGGGWASLYMSDAALYIHPEPREESAWYRVSWAALESLTLVGSDTVGSKISLSLEVTSPVTRAHVAGPVETVEEPSTALLQALGVLGPFTVTNRSKFVTIARCANEVGVRVRTRGKGAEVRGIPKARTK
jgi:hypothetical protein